MNDEHPLVLELTSLRQTAARFEHEAHSAAIRLQRQTLETTRAHGRAAALERENTRLKEELAVLRVNSQVPSHPAERQVQELTLALRRVSEKIDLSERALLERTGELTTARSDLVKARHEAEGAYELASLLRSREEEGKARERALQAKARASEEERKMVDLVVQEYADLVRSLEGRKSASIVNASGVASAATPIDDLNDKKAGLQKLLAEFAQQTGDLETTVMDLQSQISFIQVSLNAERKTSIHDRNLLSQAQTELDRLRLDDQTAAKMVTRYMKFSQSSTNALQAQITALKDRHAVTISTLQLQLSQVESQLTSERTQCTHLQDALDELCEDVARETYGRRREVALRLALLAREESITESLRRWVRRARESYERSYSPSRTHEAQDGPHENAPHIPASVSATDVQDTFHRMVSDAESLLSALNDELEFSDGSMASGAEARIAVAREAVEALRSELQDEVRKRVDAVRRFGTALEGMASVHTPDLDSKNNLLEKAAEADLPSTPLSNSDTSHITSVKEENTPSQNGCSSLSVICTSKGATDDDPFKAGSPASLPITPVGSVTQDVESLEPSPTLLTTDEPLPYKEEESPAVSILDLHPAPHLYPTKESRMSPTPSPPVNNAGIQGTPTPQAVLSIEHTKMALNLQSPTSTSASLENTSPAVPQNPNLQTQIVHSESTATLLRFLSEAKHRYDALQRAFRDCSLALKELKRTLGSPSPSSSTRTVNHTQHHLLTALSRIDDFTEDARVELEIRIADEELTAHGFETLLSVPGAFTDPDERAEAETNAKRFADGTDEGVQKALERFERKLDDVQHDVAVLKRAAHEVSLTDVGFKDGTRESRPTGWTSWTAGLLSPTSSPSRSTTPAPTFGSVMTSPRLRHASSLKQLHGGPGESGDPLAGLGFKISMPSANLAAPSYPASLGLGSAPGVRPRAISTIYSLGLGARSSSVTIGVGLGGAIPSPSPSVPSPPHSGSIPTTPMTSRLGSSPLSARMGSAGPKRRGSILINGGGPDEREMVEDDEPSDVE
ncbi:hypothetical protein V8B97DRAFT_1201403 [Scleroderma yunnanense]